MGHGCAGCHTNEGHRRCAGRPCPKGQPSTLAEARDRLIAAKRMLADGKSPAREKARNKARVKDAETFGAWAEKWLRGYQMAESTRDMRRSVYVRELEKAFGNQKLAEITSL